MQSMIKQMDCIEVTTIFPFRRQEYIHDLITGEWHIVKSKHLLKGVVERLLLFCRG